MNFIILLTAIVVFLGAMKVRTNNKLLKTENERYRKTVYVESWSLPSTLHGKTAYCTDAVGTLEVQPVQEVAPVTYQTEMLDTETMNFFASLGLVEKENEIEQDVLNRPAAQEDCPTEQDDIAYLAYLDTLSYGTHDDEEVAFSHEDAVFLHTVHDAVQEEAVQLFSTEIIPQNTKETEYLTLDDCDFEISPIAIPQQYRELAEHEIIERHIGFQSWVCQVVGTEQDYIHISDGTARAWANISLFGREFNQGDIVFLEVSMNANQTLIVHTVNYLEKARYVEFCNIEEESYDDFGTDGYYAQVI